MLHIREDGGVDCIKFLEFINNKGKAFLPGQMEQEGKDFLERFNFADYRQFEQLFYLFEIFGAQKVFRFF